VGARPTNGRFPVRAAFARAPSLQALAHARPWVVVAFIGIRSASDPAAFAPLADIADVHGV
jgi:hypothetical protein